MRGFTLLEIITALAVLSVIGMLLLAGVSRTIKVAKEIEEGFEQTSLITALLDRLEAELATAIYRSDSAWTVFSGEKKDSSILLQYSAITGSPPGNPVKYRYETRSEPGSGIALYWAIAAQPFGGIPNERRFLWMDNIQQFTILYYHNKNWSAEWDSREQRALPDAVKVELIDQTGATYNRTILIPCGRVWS